MSLIAMSILLQAVAEFGRNPPADEGWQAHVFQLLMVLQIPLILLFLARNRRSLRQNLPLLGAQLVLWVLAVGAVGVLGY